MGNYRTLPSDCGAKPYQGAKALLVEDNLFNQKILSIFLANRGLRVVIAANGQDALEHLRNAAFDIIFMDCHMPVMDGIEATRHIRSQPELRNLPIIALTADVKEYHQQCLEAGMNDYLKKPLEESGLEAMLQKWMPTCFPFPAAKQADLSALDMEVLQKLRSSIRDEFPAIIEIYLGEAEALLSAIQSAVEKGDINAVQFASHSLKTASGQIGAISLYTLMKDIENMAKKGSAASLHTELEQAFLLFDQVRNALTSMVRPR